MKIPNAVTHILIPLIIVELFRDYAIKDKREFPLHYVLLAGLAGLLPDIDILVYWIANGFSGVGLHGIHRTFTHSIFFVLLFVVLMLVFWNAKWGWLGKHKLHLKYVFLVIAFGTFMHLLLDYLLIGFIMPFYPVSSWAIGLNLVEGAFGGTFIAGLDAILLASWLIHEELKHRISSFF